MRFGWKKAAAFAVAGILSWLAVRYLFPIAIPFFLGAGMALAADPGVRFLSGKAHMPRSVAAGIGVSSVFLVICALVTVLCAFLFRELGVLAGILPGMEQTIMEGLDALQGWMMDFSERTSPGIRALIQRNVTQLFSGGAAMLDRMTRYALGLAGTILSHLPDSALGLGTAVLSAFLISSELPRIRQWLDARISAQRLQPGLEFLRRLKSTAGLWLVAQLKLSGITCLMLTLGFLLLRVSYAPLWALVVSVLDALPILGTGAVLVPWSLVLLIRHEGARALGMLGLYAAAALTRSTLEPRLVGRQLGLDPLVTLIALYTGFRLWGIPGMILMPLLAITVVRMLPTGKTQ